MLKAGYKFVCLPRGRLWVVPSFLRAQNITAANDTQAPPSTLSTGRDAISQTDPSMAIPSPSHLMVPLMVIEDSDSPEWDLAV